MVNLIEVENMFWGVTLEGEKRYSQTVAKAFHISMAALEPNTGSGKDSSVVSVMLQQDQNEFLLCSLQQGKLYQQPLDLNFIEGEEVILFLNGQGRVHLTGYINVDEEPDDLGDMSELQSGSDVDSEADSDDESAPELESTQVDSDEEDSDEEEASPVKGKRKRKQEGGDFKRTKKMLEEAGDDDESEDDSEFDENINSLLEGEDFNSDDWETDDDEEEEEDDEDEDSEMDGSFQQKQPTPKAKKKKGGQDTPASGKKQAPNPVVKVETQAATPSSEKKKGKKGKQEAATPASASKQQNGEATTPDSSPEKSSEKKKKKKKKNKKKGETPNAAGDNQTPSSTNDKAANTPASGKKQQQGTPASGQKQAKKRTLAGGLIVEDLKDGHGPEAKPGKMVGVYYTGKLTNNKTFDSTTSGKPFKFKLGKSEVIKGWDEGLKGMKVGGKRKLTVPAKMAYGSQSVGGIPANSTLVFEVELKNVN